MLDDSTIVLKRNESTAMSCIAPAKKGYLFGFSIRRVFIIQSFKAVEMNHLSKSSQPEISFTAIQKPRHIEVSWEVLLNDLGIPSLQLSHSKKHL